jgi:acyl-coenzyme A thioesterase PaaI-like protein
MTSFTELLDRIVAGQGKAPPIVEALKLPSVTGWKPGRVWSDWEVHEAIIGPGGVFGGYFALVADSLAGLAVQSILDEGLWLSTATLEVRFLAPATSPRLSGAAFVDRQEGRKVWVKVEFTSNEVAVCRADVLAVIFDPRSKGIDTNEWIEGAPE